MIAFAIFLTVGAVLILTVGRFIFNEASTLDASLAEAEERDNL